MKSFLALVAEDLFRNTHGNFKDLTVVFPNRRAGSVFRKEIRKLADKPIWSPRITSIDDWLVDLSGVRQSDALTGITHLYSVVAKHFSQTGSFSSFIEFGEIILKDFDDADKYLANPGTLFKALAEIKNIDELYDISEDEELRQRILLFWRSFGKEPSGHQGNWLSIWEKLSIIYNDFHASLHVAGLATSGMCYRKAAHLINSADKTRFENWNVVFVGFNILTKAEERIFDSLKTMGKATFYWDYHPFYLEKYHDAGRFIQRYLDDFPAPLTFSPFGADEIVFFNDDSNSDRLRVFLVTSNTGQIQNLVTEISSESDTATLVVLSDESLLPDLISSWNPAAGQVNFTSGYPLLSTTAATLLRSYLAFAEDLAVSGTDESVDSQLVADLFSHPWFQSLTGCADDKNDPRFNGATGSRIALQTVEEFPGQRFIKGIRSPELLFSTILELLNQLKASPSFLMPLERAAVELLSGEIEHIRTVLTASGIGMDHKSIKKLMERYLQSTRITLESDRNAPVQVTGILETRLLDFDRIFILSFNEGIWPSKSLPGSLIPYSLRKYFSLPTAENRDAMYAYYFYRLVQRASSVTLYSLSGHRDDGIRSGEISRYVSQLRYGSEIPVRFQPEPPVGLALRGKTQAIEKNREVLLELDKFRMADSARSISASSLNDYLDCPFRFALKNVYRIREPFDVESVSEPKGFGQLLHSALEDIYKPFLNNQAGPPDSWYREVMGNQEGINTLLKKFYSRLNKESKNIQPQGKDQIALVVAREFITEALKADQADKPERILGLEKVLHTPYPMTPSAINIKAVIDRIDSYQGAVRIVDYKTGSCDISFSEISDLFDSSKVVRKKEIFQVLLYSEWYLQAESSQEEVMPALFRLIRLRSGETGTRIIHKKVPLDYSNVRDEFVQHLNALLAEIFNPETPFSQTVNDAMCRYCNFAGLCRKD